MNGDPRRGRPVVRVRMLHLGKFFGVPLYFAPSWLLIAALLTISYGPFVEQSVPGISASSAYLLSFGYALLFALCVLAHELGHTAVSLMLRHPVRRVVIFLLGGVSEIEREPDRPRDEFLIAAAGPLVSVLLTGIGSLGVWFTPSHSMLGVLLELLTWANGVVVVFNLLPGLPLDGGRIVRSVIWRLSKSRLTGTRIGAWTGRVVAVAVFLLFVIINRTDGVDVFYTLVGAVLAAYLWGAAGASLKHAQVLDKVPQLELERLLRPGLLVPADLSVDAALRRLWQGSARGLVLVDAFDRPAAIVDESQVNAVAPERRPWVPLSDVARPLEDGLVLRRGLSGQELIDAVSATPASEYLVVDDDGAPAGILATADLAAALRAWQ
jgi:Zn-dependent protease